MTRTQKIQLRQSEAKVKMGELLDSDVETRSATFADDLATVTTELRSVEVELQAAILSDGDQDALPVDAEGREFSTLETRANIGGIFDAAFKGSVTTGAEAELQAHLGLSANSVPLALLRGHDDEVEIRTSGVTPAPATGAVGIRQMPIIPYVFPASAASFLRIAQPSVGVGEAVYSIITTAASPGTPAKGANQAHSAAAFGTDVLAPKRIQASLFYAIEDKARLAGMGEALRANLSDALSDKLDDVILTGTEGLFTGIKLANHDASAADSFATYTKRFMFDYVDGTYATTAADLRMVVGSATYGDMGTSYQSNGDLSALDNIMARTGGVRVSAHVPAAASMKQEAVIRRGGRMDAVAPIWEGIELIVDPYTQTKAGEVVVSAVMLYNFKILRAVGGFAKVEAQHS